MTESETRIARAREWLQEQVRYRTHWEGCESDHGGCAALACLDELERLRSALTEIGINAPAEEPEYDDWGGDTERAEQWGMNEAWWVAGGIARRALATDTAAPAAERETP